MKRRKAIKDRRAPPGPGTPHLKVAEGHEAYFRKQVRSYLAIIARIRPFLSRSDDKAFRQSFVRARSTTLTKLHHEKLIVDAGRVLVAPGEGGGLGVETVEGELGEE